MSDVWRVESLEPWAANGPGWANCGVSALVEGPPVVGGDGITRLRQKRITIYDRDLSAEEHLALSIGIMAHGVLGRRILAEIAKGAATPASVYEVTGGGESHE